jgi:hypothetical protein
MAGVWISVCSRRSFSRIFGAPQLGRPLELNDQPLDLKRQLVRMPVGPPTAIGQSFEPAILIALEDLVAGLARDIELAGQRRHLLAVEQSRYESEAFIHLVTLLPRHFALPRRPEVLPMCPE